MKSTTEGYDGNARQIVIKDFAETDRDSYTELYVHVFHQAPWYETWAEDVVQRNLRRMMSRKTWLGLTAWYEGPAVGYLLGHCMYDLFPLNKFFYVDSLFVDDTCQNMGIGKQLLSTAMMRLHARKVPTILLLTKPESNAETFYRKRGFTRLGDRVQFRKKILMYRQISTSSDRLDSRGSLENHIGNCQKQTFFRQSLDTSEFRYYIL
jgi:ribosomal protein S18 acetylase RimI-like enzyme